MFPIKIKIDETEGYQYWLGAFEFGSGDSVNTDLPGDLF
jgi:hypothetical protein